MQVDSRLLATGLVLALNLVATPLARAELITLFTTPQERQVINANRYKSDQPKPVPTVQFETDTNDLSMQQLVKEVVTREYSITGITLSPEGAHRVWINSKVYADGEQLDDKSRIKVLVGSDIKVRITAPDGKHYFATSGEALKVTYLAPIEN